MQHYYATMQIIYDRLFYFQTFYLQTFILVENPWKSL